jgi:hypothetical protein
VLPIAVPIADFMLGAQASPPAGRNSASLRVAVVDRLD